MEIILVSCLLQLLRGLHKTIFMRNYSKFFKVILQGHCFDGNFQIL